MSDTNKKPDIYIFDGEMYEKDQNGNIHKLINNANIKAGNGIVLDKSEVDNSVTINSDLGLSIVNGQLCVTYEKEVE